MSILTPNNKIGRIFFGAPEDPTGAKLQWNNDADLFTLGSSKLSGSTAIHSGNDVEAIRIDENQNVGIGTTTPTKLLHVSGSALISGSLTVGTVDGDQILLQDGSESNPSLSFSADTDTGIYRPGFSAIYF